MSRLALALLVVAASAQGGPVHKLAMPAPTAVRIGAGEAAFVANGLAGALTRRGLPVVTSEDVGSLLGYERQKQLLGCDGGSCELELGEALGADAILRVEVAALEGAYQLHARVVSARDGAALFDEQVKAATQTALGEKLDALATRMTQALGVPPASAASAASKAIDAGHLGRSDCVGPCARWTVERQAGVGDLNALWLGSDGTLWAAGASGTVLRRDGTGWHADKPATISDLYAVAEADGRVWTAGIGGALFSRGPAGWRAQPGPKGDLFSLAVGAPGELWLGGEGVWLRTGTGWREALKADRRRVLGLCATGKTVVGVSNRGEIIQRAGAGLKASIVTTDALNAAWTEDRERWVVGPAGRAFRFEDGAWATVPSPTTEALTGVRGTGPKDVWVVTLGGKVFSWNGVGWENVPAPFDDALYDVWVTPQAVWVSGANGLLARFDRASPRP